MNHRFNKASLKEMILFPMFVSIRRSLEESRGLNSVKLGFGNRRICFALPVVASSFMAYSLIFTMTNEANENKNKNTELILNIEIFTGILNMKSTEILL